MRSTKRPCARRDDVLGEGRREDLIQGNPELGLAVGLQGVNFAAIVVVPLVGAALEHGYGRLSFLLLAAFCALVGAVNFIARTD